MKLYDKYERQSSDELFKYVERLECEDVEISELVSYREVFDKSIKPLADKMETIIHKYEWKKNQYHEEIDNNPQGDEDYYNAIFFQLNIDFMEELSEYHKEVNCDSSK